MSSKVLPSLVSLAESFVISHISPMRKTLEETRFTLQLVHDVKLRQDAGSKFHTAAVEAFQAAVLANTSNTDWHVLATNTVTPLFEAALKRLTDEVTDEVEYIKAAPERKKKLKEEFRTLCPLWNK
eukprot:2632277-Rhodomonas_salina.1